MTANFVTAHTKPSKKWRDRKVAPFFFKQV